MRDAASASALMRREPSVIKRPVVDWGDQTAVGFDPAAWEALLVNARPRRNVLDPGGTP